MFDGTEALRIIRETIRRTATEKIALFASLIDEEGVFDREAAAHAAMAKFLASDTTMKVTTDAVQILRGYGYVKDYPVESMMRDAKLTQIYRGTNQITRLEAGRAILGK